MASNEAVEVNTPNKVLFVNSLGNKKTFETLMKEFTGDVECCNSDQYIWSVMNKYYKAQVLLKSCCVDENGELHFSADDYQAVVICFDCMKAVQSATLVESLVSIWAQITRRLSENSTEFEPPPICLLMAIVAEEGEYHQVILQWCVDNGFEIIEWTPGGEKASIDRLAEALQAHVWPELIMLSSKCNDSALAARSTEDMLPVEGLSTEGDGEEHFEQLFAKFASMKEHAKQLPHEERKVYAEKVVMAFWNAIGGDKEEMRDLT